MCCDFHAHPYTISPSATAIAWVMPLSAYLVSANQDGFFGHSAFIQASRYLSAVAERLNSPSPTDLMVSPDPGYWHGGKSEDGGIHVARVVVVARVTVRVHVHEVRGVRK